MKTPKIIRRVLDALTITTSLRECQHYSTSYPFPEHGTLVTCNYCGSTRRAGDTEWSAPWIWRAKN